MSSNTEDAGGLVQPPTGNYPQRTELRAYVRSFRGILKIFQMVLSLVLFIISNVVYWNGSGWASFVSIDGLIFSTVWFCLHIFQIIPAIIANYFIEAIYYCFETLFYFIATIVSIASIAHFPAAGAAVALCALGTLAFGADSFFQLKELRAFYEERRRRQNPDVVGVTAADNPLDDNDVDSFGDRAAPETAVPVNASKLSY